MAHIFLLFYVEKGLNAIMDRGHDSHRVFLLTGE